MDHDKLEKILTDVKTGNLAVTDAMTALKGWPSEIIECANLDHHRYIRTGIPEVIFGEKKEAWQIIEIAKRMLGNSYAVMATRVDRQKARLVCLEVPEFTYYEEAMMLAVNHENSPKGQGRGTIVILSAGTSDGPVAQEAYVTATCLGHKVEKALDVGVAGIHRLFAHKKLIDAASVLIVVAGMEGALPSVVAGMVRQPVIAVPTSVGYGTGLGGFAALLAMLNSCAPGVSVVNIDNGFGAACMAVAINN